MKSTKSSSGQSITVLSATDLTLSLKQLLSYMEKLGQDLTWAIGMLDATATSPTNRERLEKVSKDAEASERGLVLSWQELVDLAQAIHETTEAQIIGCSSPSSLPSWTTDILAVYVSCEVAIDVVDGLNWSVYVRDPDFRRALRLAWRKAKEVPFSQVFR